MRYCTPALKSFLDGVRAVGGTTPMADCYTFALTSGPVLRYSSLDVPVTVGGNVFSASALRVSGLRFRCAVGLDVDSQELDIVASPSDMVGTVPFLVALRIGLFDGCMITRDRAFFALTPTGLADTYAAPAIGSVNLFTGRIATIDSIGRTSAKVTVASLLAMLDVDMPRNYYQPNCNHALYDAGCGLAKSAYATPGTVGAGSTASTIKWSGAAATFTQGTLTMTSGVLAGLTAGIKAVAPGELDLVLPFEIAPTTGDTFTAYPGCDHTTGAAGCAKFANLKNFRGFPYIPPATSTYSGGA